VFLLSLCASLDAYLSGVSLLNINILDLVLI
jgi:hypothetical protein